MVRDLGIFFVFKDHPYPEVGVFLVFFGPADYELFSGVIKVAVMEW